MSSFVPESDRGKEGCRASSMQVSSNPPSAQDGEGPDDGTEPGYGIQHSVPAATDRQYGRAPRSLATLSPSSSTSATSGRSTAVYGLLLANRCWMARRRRPMLRGPAGDKAMGGADRVLGPLRPMHSFVHTTWYNGIGRGNGGPVPAGLIAIPPWDPVIDAVALRLPFGDCRPAPRVRAGR